MKKEKFNIIKESVKNNIFIHRVTQTKGIMMLTDEEIEAKAKEYENQIEVKLKNEPSML